LLITTGYPSHRFRGVALLSNLPLEPNPYLLLTLHCIIGIIAALLARRKGFDFRRWLIIGLIGGTPALIVALVVKPKL